ncbi:MAG TPA: beta-L-arabinofuranosidase domain-containing protein [Chryseolinea sp.]|nr:beta-L-arabinofuranosidase domain-containing protein [Chryseolinea sp.]
MHFRPRTILLICLFLLSAKANSQTVAPESPVARVQAVSSYLEPHEVVVGGKLGEFISADRRGRISELPKWKDGQLITMFGKAAKDHHDKMDWYGEHGGKWLYMASHAAKHSGDKEMEATVLRTADYFVQQQDADGYLGNYGPAVRLTNDAISHKRSWDVWNLSYMVLGLLQTNRYYPNPAYLKAATSIGDLFVKMFGDGKHNITEYGTRRGVSATVILDPLAELYKATRDTRYLNLAETVLKEAEANPDHRIITAGLNNLDMENVGDGKIYQIIWNVTGIVKLYEVTANPAYLKAATNIWQNITDHHLNITGGPWGGIGKHMECFNRKNYWSPYGMVETCSTMSWIQLNKELLRITGDARYAQEIEKSAYNALPGARFPNGLDWSYHSFNNGSWSVANFNDCCPSSGAMALEELPALIYSRRNNGIALNLFTESEATIKSGKNTIKLVQKTQYPFDGSIRLAVSSARKEAFPLMIRIPDWASDAAIRINGQPLEQSLTPGTYVTINRTWGSKDLVEIAFPVSVRIATKLEELDGPQNAGEIYHAKWFAVTRGPLVYSVDGLIEGDQREPNLNMDVKDAIQQLQESVPAPSEAPAYVWRVSGQPELRFVPYYAAGGMKKGGWRLTWLLSGIDK